METSTIAVETDEFALPPILPTTGRLSPADREALSRWTEQAIRAAHGVWASRRSEIETDVILRHLWLADSLARRYRRRGEEDDDLTQVARRGLVEAVQRYQPDHGSFVSFAVPTITGVIKRHFRDHGWLIRPPRPTQHLAAEVRRTWPELAQRLGTDPSVADMATALGEPVSAIREARRASQGYTHATFDVTATDPASVTGDHATSDLAAIEARVIITRACRELPAADLELLVLRFDEDRTQSEIAAVLGTSQMQVSRRLAKLLLRLQSIIGPLEPAVADAVGHAAVASTD